MLSALAGVDACAEDLGESPDYEIVDAGPGRPDLVDAAEPSVDATPLDAGDGCPSGRGPELIRAGATCVDRTEVTYAQYQQFIDDTAGDAGGQVPECIWNDYLPYSGWPYPVGMQHHPVRDVTWCSAHAYCLWAGKRLCGTPGTGASVAPKDVADASADEWFAACSRGGERVYPYGDSFQPDACNVGEAGTVPPAYREGSVPVATMQDCEGGYAGIMDMSGNAEEWENACEATTAGDAGRMDVCLVRGGGFGTPTDKLACDGRGRLFRGNHAGIRCCATPEF